MTRLKLLHVDRFTDATGTRAPLLPPREGQAHPPAWTSWLRGVHGRLPEALAASTGKRAPAGLLRGPAGTFGHLTSLYYASPDYIRLSPSAKGVYRGIIDNLLQRHGIAHRRVDQMRREHVDKIVARLASTPAAANNALKKLRLLIAFAIAHGWRSDDPTRGVKFYRGGTHHTWTEAEIAAFTKAWPEGTVERLAFGLLLHTGQRVGDVARMSWRDLDAAGASISLTQHKTRAELIVPVHPDLARLLQGAPRAHISILTTPRGRPFIGKTLGDRLAKAVTTAGLPDRCVTHGLRKAAARQLAEAGCSAHQIMSITGHASLAEVERYTKAAAQKALAVAAIGRLTNKASQNP